MKLCRYTTGMDAGVRHRRRGQPVPGDVVLTGTAAGSRTVSVGDVMQVEVEGIGTLTNPVVARPVPVASMS